jgi:hypothetical protein
MLAILLAGFLLSSTLHYFYLGHTLRLAPFSRHRFPEVLRELGTTSNFGDWTCRNYEQVAREKKLADICIVPFESLHLTVSDISSYRSMADLMLYFAGDPATNVLSHSGVPIRATSYVGGRAMIESTLVASKEMALDRSLFQQPTDLRKVEVVPTASHGR